jgi:hypothetical protein
MYDEIEKIIADLRDVVRDEELTADEVLDILEGEITKLQYG